jgi:pyrroloquinoline quinone (PQQ) biosynthesis protein C
MATTTMQKPLRAGEFETELRKLADSIYTKPVVEASAIAKLVSNTLDIKAARNFWSQSWHLDQAYNQYALPRLMEACPDVDARVQVFDAISMEWGYGDPNRAHPKLYRDFLLGLGVGADAVPWEYDVQHPEVVSHVQRWNSDSWLGLLVDVLLGVKTIGPKMYGTIADALLAAPYGLTEGHVAFFRTRATADAKDCDIAFELVSRYAVTVEQQEQARRALYNFATESRFALYCCNLGTKSYFFEAQPGGIPVRLRDPIATALRGGLTLPPPSVSPTR